MARFIKTLKDREGRQVVVECGFKAADGQYYLLLRRLPPLYARDPVWLVRLSSDTVTQRAEDGSSESHQKAYCIQDLNKGEKKLLMECKAGVPTLPFFNFSYPNVIRILGKQFTKLEDPDLAPLLQRVWALIP